MEDEGFESCHPDTVTRANCGKRQSVVGALGALETYLFGFGVVTLNQNRMIKSLEIKNAGGDISRRWYVEYRELDPDANRWIRKREYGVNHIKDPLKRMEALQEISQELLNSFMTRREKLGRDLKSYLRAYAADKSKFLRTRSMVQIKLALKYFFLFAKESSIETLPLHKFKRQHIHEFRQWLCGKIANRSVNGHISQLRTFFNYFIDNYDDVIYKNPCSGIKRLPTRSETHVAYTADQVKSFFEYLKEKDPQLLMYCQFVGLAFIRCEEARHLRVADIDFSRRTITLTASRSKNSKRITKPLLETFYNILVASKVYDHKPDHFIFSKDDHPGPNQCHYNFFRNRFRKLKVKFSLSTKHTIYSFRHTYVSQLLDNGAKWHEVMKYTGHSTMEAFAQYARSLHVKPAEDLSRYLSQ